MKKLLILALVGVTMALSTGCYPDFPPTGGGNGNEENNIRQETTLSVQYGAQVQHSDLSVTLTDVLDDSRCPSDVECVWMGNARVVLTLKKLPQGDPVQVELNTNPSFPQKVEFENYEITLVDLKPYPVSTETIDPRDYIAVLQIVEK